ncbi:hypothetical protein LIA77_11603 [Sarocladium implicatum]|nr:hypothetical protein LIA77_11603 [Sarocladium implicatum]
MAFGATRCIDQYIAIEYFSLGTGLEGYLNPLVALRARETEDFQISTMTVGDVSRSLRGRWQDSVQAIDGVKTTSRCLCLRFIHRIIPGARFGANQKQGSMQAQPRPEVQQVTRKLGMEQPLGFEMLWIPLQQVATT